MSILNGASGQNDNTIIYIVNALRGDVKTVNTLAMDASRAAQAANDGVTEIVTVTIQNLQSNFTSELSKTDSSIRSYVSEQVGGEVLVKKIGEQGIEEILNKSQKIQEMSTELEQTSSAFIFQFQNEQGAIPGLTNEINAFKSWIEANSGGLILGNDTSTIQLKVMNDGIQIYSRDNPGEPITFWNSEQQLQPRQVIIPTGGSLTIGNFRWVPRTGPDGQPGNLSLIKV
jgi:hypothetical protein